MGFYCKTCESFHDNLPLDLAFQKPDECLEIPQNEISKRVWLNSESNADICMIDNSKFYIRGILALPVIDLDNEFRFGIWCWVKEENCKRYYELWDENDVSQEPGFDGIIANKLPYFEESFGLAVKVRLQSNNQRPLFFVSDESRDLATAQNAGITMDEVHKFLERKIKL